MERIKDRSTAANLEILYGNQGSRHSPNASLARVSMPKKYPVFHCALCRMLPWRFVDQEQAVFDDLAYRGVVDRFFALWSRRIPARYDSELP